MIEQLRAYTAFKEKPYLVLPFTSGTSQPLFVQLWDSKYL